MNKMTSTTGWKGKFARELKEYFLNALYLLLFFGMITTYRRLLMAEYHIDYEDYGICLVKALILAKIIMVGDMFRLGHRFHDKPLIYPTLYKTVAFTLLVLLFSILEATIKALLHGKGLAGGWHELWSGRQYEVLAEGLIVFFAFLPFFAFRELERILGEGRIRGLFLRRQPAGESQRSGRDG